jgi:hypothetical protein
VPHDPYRSLHSILSRNCKPVIYIYIYIYPRQQGRRAARPAGALPRRAGVRLPGGQDARGGVPLHVAQRPLEGLLQVCAETVMMLVVARPRRSVLWATHGRTCCGATAGEEAWVESPGTGCGNCVLNSSIHDQSEFLELR